MWMQERVAVLSELEDIFIWEKMANASEKAFPGGQSCFTSPMANFAKSSNKSSGADGLAAPLDHQCKWAESSPSHPQVKPGLNFPKCFLWAPHKMDAYDKSKQFRRRPIKRVFQGRMCWGLRKEKALGCENIGKNHSEWLFRGTALESIPDLPSQRTPPSSPVSTLTEICVHARDGEQAGEEK